MKHLAFSQLSLSILFCMVSTGSYSNECADATRGKISNPLLVLIGIDQVDLQEKTCKEHVLRRINIDEKYFSAEAEDSTFRTSMTKAIYQPERKIPRTNLTTKAGQAQKKSDVFIETLRGYRTLAQ